MYFSDVIVSKMRVKSRSTDMPEWVSTIRRTCHALFLYELKGYRCVLFGWCHDPPGHPKPCPPDKVRALPGSDICSEQMSEPGFWFLVCYAATQLAIQFPQPDIRPTNSDTTGLFLFFCLPFWIHHARTRLERPTSGHMTCAYLSLISWHSVKR